MPDKAVQVFIEDLQRRRRARAKQLISDKDISLFSGLSDDGLETLLSRSHMQDFPAGQEIVRQGEEAGFLYFVIQGSVKTLRYSAEGEEATIRMLKPGETFMDAVIFMGGLSPISARAIEDSKLLLIPAETVRRHSLSDPQFANNLLKIVTRHYKTAIQQIDSITTKNPVERVGYYFLKQHLLQGHDSMDMVLPFQKATIANHLGMTPETFSRTLKQIRDIGIDIDGEKIKLRDACTLCRFCDSDTAALCDRRDGEDCPLCPIHRH